MSSAHGIATELEFGLGAAIIGIGTGLQAGIERSRQRAAECATNDAAGAAAVAGATAQVHARVASDRLGRLMLAEARIEQLEDRVERLEREKTELVALCGHALDQLEAQRARAH